MSFFIDDVLGQTVATPFVVAFVLALLLRVLLGQALGRKLAVAGAVAGFLLAFTLIQGLPDFPPGASVGKVFYIVLIGAVLGLVLDLAGATRSGGHALAFILPIAALAWLTQRIVANNPVAEWLWPAALLFIASILVYWRIAATARGSDEEANRAAGLFPPILVLVAAIGLSLLALLGASASLSFLGAALAAATGGFLLASYIVYLAGGLAFRFDAIGAFGVAGALLALAYVVLLFNQETNRLALGILLLTFIFDFWARPAALSARLGSGGAARALRPVAYGLIVAIPAAAALLYVYVILGQRPGG